MARLLHKSFHKCRLGFFREVCLVIEISEQMEQSHLMANSNRNAYFCEGMRCMVMTYLLNQREMIFLRKEWGPVAWRGPEMPITHFQTDICLRNLVRGGLKNSCLGPFNELENAI